MSREQFVAGWLERSGITAEQLAEMGLSAAPCDCEWPACEGWGMVREVVASSAFDGQLPADVPVTAHGEPVGTAYVTKDDKGVRFSLRLV